MSNTINQEQNSESHLAQLAAQRVLYSQVKGIVLLQLVLIGAVPLVLSTLATFCPGFKVWAALYGISVSMVDAVLLDAITKKKRVLAARIQELFDCEVLHIDWNDFRAGERPDPEDVALLSRMHLRINHNHHRLENWYPKEIERLPLDTGRLACQRANCWWDSNLRQKYQALLGASLGVIGIAAIVAGIARNMTLEDFVLGLLASLSPIFLAGIRAFRKQSENIAMADKLKKQADKLWQNALAKKLSSEELTCASRELQNEIFAHRCNKDQVSDWLYNFSREKQEIIMNDAAARMLQEAKSAGLVNN